MRQDEPDETRAEVARRRLAQLAAAFDAEMLSDDTELPSPREEMDTSVATVARARLSVAHLRVVGVLAVAGLVLLGWMLLSGRPHSSDAVPPVTVASSGPEGGSDEPTRLVIDVVGEVENPGIVAVPRGSRVYQAIEAAGGLKGTVDTSGVNLARVLDDGEQIVVGPASDGAGGDAVDGKIRLNLATPEQLDTLPGIGPVTAAAIVAWREENGRFATVDDLLDVTGIGDATFADLRDLVVP
ncbi:MAG: ComEA family DNA-binding protein [Aeromicrobium sp.]|uniref:helix-hairpin-helix domain-containing protein n=1 Tax=Aeromicrobium sp. TaxID=1871063 RepID=UPI003C45B995